MQTFLPSIRSRKAFQILLPAIRPDAVLDIGSRNGNEALSFREILPHAVVFAIEANPALVAEMRSNEKLSGKRIRILNYALSDKNGIASFSIFSEKKKMGSLGTLLEHDAVETVSVETKRLDSFSELKNLKNIALWVDVEGFTHEVLEGAGELLPNVCIVHAEIETETLWSGQKLVEDVNALMEKHGFIPVCVRIKEGRTQGDIIYMKKEIAKQEEIRRVIARANLMQRVSLLSARLNVREKLPGIFGFGKRIMRALFG